MRTVRELHKASNGSYRITIAGDDGVNAPFRLSEDLVVELRLLPGRTLDEAAYARLLAGLDFDRLYEAALCHLARTAKSDAEMRNFLNAKTDDQALADRVRAKLLAKGLVDDRALALAVFDYRFDVVRDGPRKIAFDLAGRGVHESYVAEAVAGATDEGIRRNLDHLFARKLPSLRGQPRAKALRAMESFLVRRGYAPGDVLPYCGGRATEFPEGEEEKIRAAADLAKARRRLAGRTEDSRELQRKLMMALKNRGYSYETIRRVMEEANDESQTQ